MSSEQEIFERYGRTYNTGDFIFREGDPGTEMFIIQSGKVGITKLIKGGVEKTLASLGPGDFFGEMAVIDKANRSANAVAVEPSRLISLDEEVFEMHMQTNPKIVKKILKNLTTRLRDANQQIANLMIRDTNSRVANTIQMEVLKRGEEGVEGISMNPPFIIGDLSRSCGVDIEKAREVVDKMVKARVLKLFGETIVVTSTEGLEKWIRYLEMKEQFGE